MSPTAIALCSLFTTGFFLGCAPRPASPPWVIVAPSSQPAPPTEARTPVNAESRALSPEALASYERARVTVQPGKAAGAYTLTRAHQTLSEREFRRAYRQVTRSDDLEADARERARARNPTLLAAGSGAAFVGVGGLTALAETHPTICDGEKTPNCGKAALGIGVLALVGGVGLYTLGCEAIKGADCILDGNVGVGEADMSLAAAQYFVARYDERLLESLRVEAPDAPASPEASEDRPSAAPRTSGAHVRVTPFGVVGSF